MKPSLLSISRSILNSSISHPHKKKDFFARGEKRTIHHHLENFHHVTSSWLLASLIGVYSFLGTSFILETYAANASLLPPQVINFKGVAMKGSVLLAWRPIPSSSAYPRVTDYMVEYKLSTNPSFKIFPDGVGTGASAKVKSLIPGKTYDFRVRAKNRSGFGEYSKKLRITLPTNTRLPTPSTPVTKPGSPSSTGAMSATGDALSPGQDLIPVNGVCGTSSGQTLTTLPTNLCTTGTASQIASASFSYTWSCAGMSGGTTASCTAYITSNYTYSWVTGSYGSCSLSCGEGTQTRSVSCVRNDGAPVADSYCTTTKPASSQSCNIEPCTTPINGVCGVFHGQTLTETPSLTQTTNFCTTGGMSAVASETSSYTWSCSGTNGGTTANCSANK